MKGFLYCTSLQEPQFPTEILQLIKSEVCKPLSKIYNLAVMSEIHPEKLKFVNVIPIHKKRFSNTAFQL